MKCKYIFEVELINYLNQIINHENLYEVYSSESKLDNLCLKSSVVGPHDRNNQQDLSSFIIHDKSNEYNSHSCNYIDFIFNSSNEDLSMINPTNDN